MYSLSEFFLVLFSLNRSVLPLLTFSQSIHVLWEFHPLFLHHCEYNNVAVTIDKINITWVFSNSLSISPSITNFNFFTILIFKILYIIVWICIQNFSAFSKSIMHGKQYPHAFHISNTGLKYLCTTFVSVVIYQQHIILLKNSHFLPNVHPTMQMKTIENYVLLQSFAFSTSCESCFFFPVGKELSGSGDF